MWSASSCFCCFLTSSDVVVSSGTELGSLLSHNNNRNKCHRAIAERRKWARECGTKRKNTHRLMRVVEMAGASSGRGSRDCLTTTLMSKTSVKDSRNFFL